MRRVIVPEFEPQERSLREVSSYEVLLPGTVITDVESKNDLDVLYIKQARAMLRQFGELKSHIDRIALLPIIDTRYMYELALFETRSKEPAFAETHAHVLFPYHPPRRDDVTRLRQAEAEGAITHMSFGLAHYFYGGDSQSSLLGINFVISNLWLETDSNDSPELHAKKEFRKTRHFSSEEELQQALHYPYRGPEAVPLLQKIASMAIAFGPETDL